MANATKTKKQETELVPPRRGKIKEVFSELKRVTWPTFPTVLKTTGVVLVIVFVFLVVVTGVDFGLAALLELIS